MTCIAPLKVQPTIFSGQGDVRYAERELLKIKQDGIIIVSISETELREVAEGSNFFSMLRDLYEQEHLDLQSKAKKRKSARK
jgi:hypothetical protein